MNCVFVAGAGVMGTGIAQACAQSGRAVILYNRRQSSLDRAMGQITKNLERSVAKGRITPEGKEEIYSRITFSTDIKLADQADLVVESMAENMEVKHNFFSVMKEVCKPQTLFASNTSSLSITEIASGTDRPDKVIGLHFFNPVPAMKLLELVTGHLTSEETYEQARAFGESLGKICIKSIDKAGFIVNRLIDPMINEAVCLVEENVGTPEDIDNGCKFGLNHPMGPLALGDLIGWDVMLAVMEVLYQESGDPKYRPAPLMRRMVRAGELGVKSGKGFYEYPPK